MKRHLNVTGTSRRWSAVAIDVGGLAGLCVSASCGTGE
jgi:hypothetical protein